MQKIGHYIASVCNNLPQMLLIKKPGPSSSWKLKIPALIFHGSRSKSWCCSPQFFTKRTVRRGSKRRCLWISGMMQSEEFCMLDELTRHNSEADKTETSTLTHVEKPQMSPNALPFLNCTERLNSIWNQILGPWGWKTYCAPPIELRLNPFRLFYAATVWITLSPSFFPNRFVSGHKFSISGQATLYNLVNSVVKTCLKSKEKGSDNEALFPFAELKCTFFDSVTLLHFGMKLPLFPSNLHLKCLISMSHWICNNSANPTLASVKPPWFSICLTSKTPWQSSF